MIIIPSTAQTRILDKLDEQVAVISKTLNEAKQKMNEALAIVIAGEIDPEKIQGHVVQYDGVVISITPPIDIGD